MYSGEDCPGCAMAEGALRQLGMPYKEVLIDRDPELARRLAQHTGMHTIPQIFVNGTYIGSTMELIRSIQTGEINNYL